MEHQYTTTPQQIERELHQRICYVIIFIFIFFLRLGGFLAGVGCVIRDNLGYYWPGSWLYL